MGHVERIELRSGYSISRVIKGGWQLSGDHGAVDRSVAVQDMHTFVQAGITTFDCADIYTGVEEMIGEFVKEVKGQPGGWEGAGIKIHTKFVPDYDQLGRISPEYVTSIIDRSLNRLQVPRLDLVQFHWWDYGIPGYLETLHMLKALQADGKIDKLAVTNFDAEHVIEIVESGIDLVSAQVQYSLLDNRPVGRFVSAAQERNVYLLCYGVLAGGFLTRKWLGSADPGYHFENRSLVKYRLIIEEFGGWDLFQALLRTLDQVASRHQVALSTVAIRYMLDQPQVGAAIVGARYARYIPHTVAAFAFDLSDVDRREIAAVLSQRKGPQGPVYALERDKNGTHGRIMKYNLNEK